TPIRNTWVSVLDHSRRYQDFTYVYPVISRRSRGLSIGINLNPDKVCNFDCVYCEVDRKVPGKAKDVNLAQVRDELRWLVQHALEGGLAKEAKFAEVPVEVTQTIRDIAFSGDGEPTMVHNLDECVQVVVEVKEEFKLAETKIVLITDAAGLDKASVKRGLEIMDRHPSEIWGKLDAGTEAYFRTVNRSPVRFERILTNLLETSRVRPIIIQSLFLRVHGEVMEKAELDAYCARLNAIVAGGGKIREVHAYTIARPTPEAWATKLLPTELAAIAETIRASTGLPVVTFD
ncbi:MAG TPA: radical SAM protein, partial [Candidatus Limnocylindria bacterium]|nr:radical SAM protein [Candidatus Limnocylindria bacterium]